MPGKQQIKTYLPLLKLLISISLAVFLYRRVDLRQVTQTIVSINPALLLVIYCLFFINTCLSSFKWRIFLAADGIHVPFRTLVASYMIGTFFNIFLPSSIGGDAYRVYDIAHHSPSTAHSFASVLADRLTGFLALVTLGLVAALIGFRSLPEQGFILFPLVFCGGIAFMIWLIYQQRLLRYGLKLTRLDRVARIERFFGKFLSSFESYRDQPRLFHRVMAISALFQVIAVLGTFLIARALHIEIPLLYFYIFVPLVTLMEALPISIYGVGVRDASYVIFFTQVGHTEVEALSMALAYVMITLVYSLFGGVLLLLRPSRNVG